MTNPYKLYSSTDKRIFDWEAEAESLPEIIKEMGKWLAIKAMNIDPNMAKDNSAAKCTTTHWYIFKGPNNINGVLIGESTITVKRYVQ